MNLVKIFMVMGMFTSSFMIQAEDGWTKVILATGVVVISCGGYYAYHSWKALQKNEEVEKSKQKAAMVKNHQENERLLTQGNDEECLIANKEETKDVFAELKKTYDLPFKREVEKEIVSRKTQRALGQTNSFEKIREFEESYNL